MGDPEAETLQTQNKEKRLWLNANLYLKAPLLPFKSLFKPKNLKPMMTLKALLKTLTSKGSKPNPSPRVPVLQLLMCPWSRLNSTTAMGQELTMITVILEAARNLKALINTATEMNLTTLLVPLALLRLPVRTAKVVQVYPQTSFRCFRIRS